MCLENYEDYLIVFLLICDFVMAVILVKGCIEFRKANAEFEAMVREKREMNNQIKK
jgi:cell division protein FtsL